jgi:cytochrome c-type biogenesis protein
VRAQLLRGTNVERRANQMTSLSALGLLAAFGGGLVSFLAPCVLPLVPSYLTYLAGASLEGAPTESIRLRVSLHAFWFVIGFTALFTTLGAAVGLFGSALGPYQLVLERIGGLLLILFGVVLTGLIRVPLLSSDYRFQVKSGRAVWWRSGLTGLAFGASWSACTGPMLGAVLVLTAGSRAALPGATLMLAFALGLAVPFMVIGLMIDQATPFLRRIRRYTAASSTLGGVILIALGLFLVTGLFSKYG